MKYFIAALLLMTATAYADVFTYDAEVIEVLDGDTVKVRIPAWPEPLQKVSIRIFGVDTPESHLFENTAMAGSAKCEKERDLGLKAKALAKTFVEPGEKIKVDFDTSHKDKYNGRMLSDIMLKTGKMWSATLIEAGVARPYGVDGASLTKSDWCN